ncbi:MAG: (E)-4-hydroxy-3-methylbut-2-enyl-diphosphate synthase [Candidatus Tectomicrobia bacterium]|nr:(E)-4-hydroxy-3-methylbut-2-enyl-diphosphate synthase [Candidatus Tectomicrobia bacterium]
MTIPNVTQRLSYCENPFVYARRKTRVVRIGDVYLGGNYPIRVQSMTTTDTCDTKATVEQIIRLYEAGCEIARVTAPSIKDAENLKNIKDELKRLGIQIPIVADIHFTPNAAMKAAEYVEKVRINPGNYADKKHFTVREYTDSEYNQELERIEERFKPLVLKCKEYGVAMRIGTNHGSLSDRIMNRYGDTPLGMVESALEFLRICEQYDYYDIVLSMKASNPQVAIQAYRLLAARMEALGMEYPFHLGVTEAGDGEDGRIKSAIGIGSLLEDGIGDTIRVSLTEDPVAEIPVAFALVRKFNRALEEASKPHERDRLPLTKKAEGKVPIVETRDPYRYSRRKTHELEIAGMGLGGGNLVRVELATSAKITDVSGTLEQIRQLIIPGSKPDIPRAEIVQFEVGNEADLEGFFEVKKGLEKRGSSVPLSVKVSSLDLALKVLPESAVVIFSPDPDLSEKAWKEEALAFLKAAKESGTVLRWEPGEGTIPRHIIELYGKTLEGLVETSCQLAQISREIGASRVILSLETSSSIVAYRLLTARLDALGVTYPILLKIPLFEPNDILLQTSVVLGSLLCDGIGDAIELVHNVEMSTAIRLSYNILQGARMRSSKTEFISCPSCGRTLFDLETTTARIKTKTGHLKGVKVAIMGCIVNGPGEMADADFGYVGAGPKNINLYVGKEIIERHIPEELADEKLIELIKTYGKWVEPESPLI